MKRLLLIGAVLAVSLGASAQGADKADTKLKFGGANLLMDGTQYYGSIESPRRKCANDRKVVVFMRGDGKDDKVGSGRSEPGKGDTYFWQVIEEGPPMAGTYYAKTSATEACRGDRSNNFLFVR